MKMQQIDVMPVIDILVDLLTGFMIAAIAIGFATFAFLKGQAWIRSMVGPTRAQMDWVAAKNAEYAAADAARQASYGPQTALEDIAVADMGNYALTMEEQDYIRELDYMRSGEATSQETQDYVRHNFYEFMDEEGEDELSPRDKWRKSVVEARAMGIKI